MQLCLYHLMSLFNRRQITLSPTWTDDLGPVSRPLCTFKIWHCVEEQNGEICKDLEALQALVNFRTDLCDSGYSLYSFRYTLSSSPIFKTIIKTVRKLCRVSERCFFRRFVWTEPAASSQVSLTFSLGVPAVLGSTSWTPPAGEGRKSTSATTWMQGERGTAQPKMLSCLGVKLSCLICRLASLFHF